MKPGISTAKTACRCGALFQRSSPYRQEECPDCRSGERRHFQDMSGKGPVKAPPLTPGERIEEHWRRWLLATLEPFLWQETVRVNDLILHLREQASKERAA